MNITEEEAYRLYLCYQNYTAPYQDFARGQGRTVGEVNTSFAQRASRARYARMAQLNEQRVQRVQHV